MLGADDVVPVVRRCDDVIVVVVDVVDVVTVVAVSVVVAAVAVVLTFVVVGLSDTLHFMLNKSLVPTE